MNRFPLPGKYLHQIRGVNIRYNHLYVFVGDVAEQRDQLDLLLIMSAQCGSRLLAHDRDHRLMVELGVVQAIQKMDGAGTGSRHAA